MNKSFVIEKIFAPLCAIILVVIFLPPLLYVISQWWRDWRIQRILDGKDDPPLDI